MEAYRLPPDADRAAVERRVATLSSHCTFSGANGLTALKRTRKTRESVAVLLGTELRCVVCLLTRMCTLWIRVGMRGNLIVTKYDSIR